MKKIFLLSLLIFIPLFCYAQDSSDDEVLNPITGFPEITEKPYIMFNEGAAFGMTNLLISQKSQNLSDLLWQDYLVGLYCEMQTGNMQPFNSIVRVAVYYPFAHTFNGMKQTSKQILIYGGDLFAGVMFQTDMCKYVRFNFAVGPHFDYRLSDEFHHLELGLGAMLGCELPLLPRWTILVNGIGSFDYGNLGTNKKVMPYDFVWQYQIEIGVRFSKKGVNQFSYIKPKQKQKQNNNETEE